ncbi:MAG TPA: pantoate--beta-alanine ligase [Chitinophagaceae bacterium]
MLLFKQKALLQVWLGKQRQEGEKIGFIPTMGALHAGHLSLIRAAGEKSTRTVCSIFVNPTQFNDKEDFDKYPATVDQDILQLEAAGIASLLLPSIAEMYPEGIAHLPRYDFGYLETVLEGKHRPGHFQGVAQVVQRLLEAVRPDYLFLGQKDFQQCLIIKKLIELIHLPVELVICPTLREPDGLAMSSRNLRLTAMAREKAPAIFQCLQYIKEHIRNLPVEILKGNVRESLQKAGFSVDYVEIADATTLQLLLALPTSGPQGKTVALIAAKIEGIRLIDNMVI